MKPLSVAVVGCGYAGAAAALFLQRAGHRVTVYEKVEEPGPVGAGIMLQPSGMGVLARLGLLGPVVARGARVSRLRARTASGRTLFELPYDAHSSGLFGVGLHRGVMFTALFEAVRAAEIDLHCGVGITRLAEGRGDVLVDDEGNERGPFDLLVVADGARSQVREASFPGVRDEPYPWGALWFVARDERRAFQDELYQVVDGAGVMMGLLPTGVGPADDPAGAPLVSFFWSIRNDRVDAFREGDFAAWKGRVSGYLPMAGEVLAQIRDQADLLHAAYRDVRMDPWHRGRLVFLGDAAHAMSPQLGQGSNLALYDAMVLADCVGAAEDPEEALAAYSRDRRRHLAYYQWANRRTTPFFQSDSRLLGALRDLAFPVANALPWVRGKMVGTMCGIERGVFAEPLPVSDALRALTVGGPVR